MTSEYNELTAILDNEEMAELMSERKPEDKLQGTAYEVKDGHLYRKTNRNEDEYLLNGWIEAKEQITIDDGANTITKVRIDFHKSDGGIYQATVSMKELYNCNFFEPFGMHTRYALGPNKRENIRDSIFAQECYMTYREIYKQTGWRIIDGKHVFLYEGGAIGADNISVELEDNHKAYSLPKTAFTDTWEVFNLYLQIAPNEIMLPLLAMAFLSPLNTALRHEGIEPAFVLWLQGRTGCRKSTLAALTLAFFGSGFNNKNLPHSFKDTANYLERSGFLLSDVLTVCDDFFPATNRQEAGNMAKIAQSVARSWGDRTGRNRMNADTSTKSGYRARGNLLCTGEDSPPISQSGLARFLTLELRNEQIKIPTLTTVQDKQDRLSCLMREYIEWLIPQYKSLGKRLKNRFEEWRTEAFAQGEGHGRMAESAAHLQIAAETFADFCKDKEYMTEAEAESFTLDAWATFSILAEEQNRRIEQDNPINLFLDALKELTGSGQCHVADIDSRFAAPPENFLGYSDEQEGFCYLLPTQTYKAVQEFYNKAGMRFPLSKNQLYKLLKDAQLIETDNNQITKGKWIRGKTTRYLWLKISALKENGDEAAAEKWIEEEE